MNIHWNIVLLAAAWLPFGFIINLLAIRYLILGQWRFRESFWVAFAYCAGQCSGGHYWIAREAPNTSSVSADCSGCALEIIDANRIRATWPGTATGTFRVNASWGAPLVGIGYSSTDATWGLCTFDRTNEIERGFILRKPSK